MSEGYIYDVAIQAVTDVEWRAVQAMYAEWRDASEPDGGEECLTAAFRRGGRTYRVAAMRQCEMGSTAGAATAMKLIARFRPRFIIMVGIAAGLMEEGAHSQFYGDVIVADEVWNCSSGKFVSPEGAPISFHGVGFVPRPKSIALLSDIREQIEAAINSPENQCHVHIGPLACGQFVMASRLIVSLNILAQRSESVGLDMESYGVAYAAQHSAAPRPTAIIVKSVCDFADSAKSDKYQKFAAHTSCEFAQLLYEKFLRLD